MLVHGEGEKMKFLKNKIKQEHGIECFMPANGETAVIPVPVNIPARISGQGRDKERSPLFF
jgi:integrator complex subunit 11